MVSRRKILSRSRDNLVEAQYEEQEEEDVWYNLDKLYKVIFSPQLYCRSLGNEDTGAQIAGNVYDKFWQRRNTD